MNNLRLNAEKVWPGTPRAKFASMGIFRYTALFFLVFATSLFLHDQYRYGDQTYYWSFYELAKRANLAQVPHLQRVTTGSSEPAYGLLIWMASRFLEKGVFISVANGIFVCQILALFEKFRGSRFAFVLVAVGYYSLVCLFAAERLKFSLIFFMAFLTVPGLARYAFAALAPAAHYQVIILYVAALAGKAVKRIRETIPTRRIRWRDIAVFAFAGAFLAYFLVENRSPIVDKISGYATLDHIETIKTIVLMGIMLITCRDKWSVVGSMVPIVVAAYVVGDERVNMMGYLVFLYFFLVEGRTWNIAFLAANAYFVWKSVPFITDVLEYGTGYPPGA
ncbi:hypothetical protein [Phenylobacterium sp.]|uniref:hypothetical protein n=1 Tax=Phenylobacterium sp. TaxID=1871053 RepID=UPI002811A833|nr:hypothetical protein [Phenylobacterium sp.]